MILPNTLCGQPVPRVHWWESAWERTAFCHFQPRVNVLPHPWCPWNAAGLYGALLETNPFCIPRFLFVENRLHSVTLHSLSSKGQIQTNSFLAYRGREGMQKQRRSSEENNRITVGQGPDSSSRNIYIHIYKYISLSSSVGTNAPMQVKDGNFRLSTRFLEHYPVTSPPTNQKSHTL